MLINLQLTDLDAEMTRPSLRVLNDVHVSVHGHVDMAMEMLMQELQMHHQVRSLQQPFVMQRHVLITAHALSARDLSCSNANNAAITPLLNHLNSGREVLLLRVGGITAESALLASYGGGAGANPRATSGSSRMIAVDTKPIAREQLDSVAFLKAVTLSSTAPAAAAADDEHAPARKRARAARLNSSSAGAQVSSAASTAQQLQQHGATHMELATGCHTLLLSRAPCCASKTSSPHTSSCKLTLQFHGHRGGEIAPAFAVHTQRGLK